MAMAADGLLPAWFASVHPRFRTPAHSTVVTWVGATLIGGLLPVRNLGELVSIGPLCAFVTSSPRMRTGSSPPIRDRKSTRLDSSHSPNSDAVFRLKKTNIHTVYFYFT